MVAEVRAFLQSNVHVFAECQAVNAFEGAPPTGGRGKFLTTQGFTWPAPGQPKVYDFYNDDSPFAQMDGVFQSVGGSEPAYTLPVGGAYQAGGVVMITKAGVSKASGLGTINYSDPACPPQVESCGKQLRRGELPRRAPVLDEPAHLEEPPDPRDAALSELALRGAVRDALDGQPEVELTKSASRARP